MDINLNLKKRTYTKLTKNKEYLLKPNKILLQEIKKY